MFCRGTRPFGAVVTLCESHDAVLPNGVSVAIEVAGEGPGLIFIHSVMGDWRSWDAQRDGFVARCRCVRCSRRYNHSNDNTMASPHHSAVQEAQNLQLLLDHLGLEKAILVGSSFGAFVALMLAGKSTRPIHAEIFRNLCRSMPQAQVQWIDGAGHGASRDNPAQFNRLALDFLDHHAAALAT